MCEAKVWRAVGEGTNASALSCIMELRYEYDGVT